jgi:putative phage-type endonuclease
MPDLANPGAEPYVPRPSIGGSDIGTLLGVNRHQSDARSIYERITAVLDSRPVVVTPDNPDMERGRELEAACVRKYERDTGRRTIHFGPAITHPDRPYMHANPDRLIVDATDDEVRAAMRGTGILEAKCPRLPVWRATREVGVNPSYYAQLQHYLAVTGLAWGSFAFLNAEDWVLYTIDVERDEEMIAQIFEVCDHFWEMVQAGNFDAQRLARHTETISEETRARAQLTAGSLVRDTPAWKQTLSAVKEAREKYAIAKAIKEGFEEVLKELVETEGVTEVVVPGIGKVTYKEQDKPWLDLDALKEDHPDLNLLPYQRRTVFRVLRPSFGRRA